MMIESHVMGLKGRCAKKAGNDRFARPGWKGREEEREGGRMREKGEGGGG